MSNYTPKEVTILGCGPTHTECPYNTEIWGVNGTYTFAPRLDKLFMTDEESEVNGCFYDIAKLVTTDTTLVLPKEYERFKNLGLKIEIYPIEQVVNRFQTHFFSNSIAYMQAYALLYEYDIIYFYGIDMMTHSTYIQEKGGVEYWMGVTDGVRSEKIMNGGPPYPLTINTKGSATGKTFNGKMYGYYGQQDTEASKEGLYVPWEFIRVGKTSNPSEEWVLVGNEYKKIAAEELKDSMGIANRV